jgi:hypothetical protein
MPMGGVHASGGLIEPCADELRGQGMTPSIIDQLSAIRDHLDQTEELVCAAHVQMAIDTLTGRTDLGSQSTRESSRGLKGGARWPWRL